MKKIYYGLACDCGCKEPMQYHDPETNSEMLNLFPTIEDAKKVGKVFGVKKFIKVEVKLI